MIAFSYLHEQNQDKLNLIIKFTLERNNTRLYFLDTLFIDINGRLQADKNYKPTDSKQHLLYTPCHPKHTSNSIPYNLARRLKIIS